MKIITDFPGIFIPSKIQRLDSNSNNTVVSIMTLKFSILCTASRTIMQKLMSMHKVMHNTNLPYCLFKHRIASSSEEVNLIHRHQERKDDWTVLNEFSSCTTNRRYPFSSDSFSPLSPFAFFALPQKPPLSPIPPIPPHDVKPSPASKEVFQSTNVSSQRSADSLLYPAARKFASGR